MLDESDADEWWLWAMLSPGSWLCITLFAIAAIVVTVLVYRNEDQCEARSCPGGQRPRLISHECLCVRPAE